MNHEVRLMSLLALSMFVGTKTTRIQDELPPKKTLNIVFIGDSITEGDGAGAPPVHAVNYLQGQQAIEKINFSNQGHSGFTTVNFLPSGGDTFKQVEHAADSLIKLNNGILVFSVMLGTNDSAIDGPLGSPVSPADYRKNIMAIADRLLNDYPGCKIILHHATWYSPNTYNSSRYLAEGLQRLQSYFPEINTIIKTYNHSHPQQVFAGDIAAFDFFQKNHLAYLIPENGQQGVFYLHPNKDGAKILGDFWGTAILKLTDKF
ncbi:MAG: GDSL-type esterase/lipase family protein [Bacteroidota bacterium]